MNQIQSDNGFNLLHAVVLTPTDRESHCRAIDLVLSEQRINTINYIGGFFNTPLHDIIANENHVQAQYLLNQSWEKGIKINGSLRDKEGKTALVLAAKMRQYEIVKKLLSWQSVVDHINTKDHQNRTALHYACMLGDWKMAQWLIDYGGSLQVIDDLGCTPLAYLSANQKTIKSCLKSVAIDPDRAQNADMNNFCDEAWQSFVHYNQAYEILIPQYKQHEVLQQITNLNSLPLVDSTKLIQGIPKQREDKPDLIQSLKARYDNLYPESLTQACLQGHLKVLDVILNKGTFNADWLLRYCAGDPDKYQLLEHIIENWLHVVDINSAGSKSGMTALHQAVKNNNSKAAIKLIQAGADFRKEANDKQGTAFDLDNGKIGNYIVRWLVSQNGELSLIGKLLDHPRIHVNAYGEQSGKTAFHQAICYGNYKVIPLLAQYQANANQPDHRGNTPLHLICSKGDAEALNNVLQSGFQFNLDQKNKQNQTPRQIIEKLPKHQREQLTNILEDQGLSCEKLASHMSNLGIFNNDPTVESQNQMRYQPFQ